MKTIFFVCTSGLSTALLLNKIKALDTQNDYTFQALSANLLNEALEEQEVDMILFTPQVRLLTSKFQKRLQPEIIVDNINYDDYVSMDAENILEQINDQLK